MSVATEFDGMPVIDAKGPIKLRITADDVSRANVKEPHNCAIARACRRELHVKEARIHLGRIYLRTNDSNWVRYQTPGALRSEIIAFDRGGSFEPGEHLLQPPPKKVAVAAVKKKSHAQKRSAKSRSGKRHVLTNIRTGPA